MQTTEERRRAALTYGTQTVFPRASGPDDLTRLRHLSDWLVQQPPSVRRLFDADLSGLAREDDAPKAGTCKAQALRLVRPRFPSSDPALAERAGHLYDLYVTQSEDYRQAEEAWVACMVGQGFRDIGSPLKVWRPGLEGRLTRIQTLGVAQSGRLSRALTRQALAEHECALGTFDDVLRIAELRVVHALLEEFPRYSARAGSMSAG
jgi:hypothetical protein